MELSGVSGVRVEEDLGSEKYLNQKVNTQKAT
jgi:hypothetical protein